MSVPRSVKTIELSTDDIENILCHVLETIMVYEYPTPSIFSALTRLGIVEEYSLAWSPRDKRARDTSEGRRPESLESCNETSERYWLAQKGSVFELLGPSLMRPADSPMSQAADSPQLSKISSLPWGSLGPSIFELCQKELKSSYLQDSGYSPKSC